MSLKVNGSGSSSQMTPLKVNEIETRLADSTVVAIQSIVSENITRKKQSALAKGIFYPHEYSIQLKQSTDPGAPARLKWFKDRDSFYEGYLSHKHFDRMPVSQCPITDSASKNLRHVFLLKKGVSPSEAIKTAKEGISLIGCGEACQIAQYAALLSILGPEKFDLLFAENSQTPLVIDSSVLVNPLNLLKRHIAKANPDSSEIKKGTQVYIYNANTYLSKHPFGIAQGFNALCVDSSTEGKKFTSLGLPSEGLTQEGVSVVLLDEYNLEDTDILDQWTTQTAEKVRTTCKQQFVKAEQLKDAKLTVDEFKQQEGGKLVLLYEWDAQRVTDLVNCSPKEARALFTEYDNQRRQKKV